MVRPRLAAFFVFRRSLSVFSQILYCNQHHAESFGETPKTTAEAVLPITPVRVSWPKLARRSSVSG